ncbi:MAG: hypothetical protein ACRCZE_03280 [Candidatus Altimarinota bacterium]
MTDKNKFGNNAETPASDLPAELVEKLKGQRADKTPVLKSRPNTQNPPKESGEYRLNSKIQTEIQQNISKVFNPRERQVISSPLNPQADTSSRYAANDIEERESLYPTLDVFAELEREKDEISKKFPRTPAPEPGKDTDYPREADTDRPPATPKPGFAAPSSAEELKAEEEKKLLEAKEQDNTPTPVPARKSPVPNGNHRKVSGQFVAQNMYEDAEFEGTPRFASPKLPSLTKKQVSKVVETVEQQRHTIIDEIINSPKTK